MAILRWSLLLFAWSFCNLLSRAISLHHHDNVPLFVFGDSLFDPGNNNYFNGTSPGIFNGNRWPYGMTYFHYPTGRLSNGRLMPDLIVEFFGLPVWKPYLQPEAHRLTAGANFASADSGVLNDTDGGRALYHSFKFLIFSCVCKRQGYPYIYEIEAILDQMCNTPQSEGATVP